MNQSDEDKAVILPNHRQSMYLADLVLEHGTPRLRLIPVIGWAVPRHHDFEFVGDDAAVPISADLYKGPACVNPLYDRETEEWWLTDVAGGQGKDSLLAYLKLEWEEQRKYEEAP